jgi:hypothetical protein
VTGYLTEETELHNVLLVVRLVSFLLRSKPSIPALISEGSTLLDRTSWNCESEISTWTLLLGLKRFEDAEAVYRNLLSLNPDCHKYMMGFVASRAKDAPSVSKEAIFDDLVSESLKFVSICKYFF